MTMARRQIIQEDGGKFCYVCGGWILYEGQNPATWQGTARCSSCAKKKVAAMTIRHCTRCGLLFEIESPAKYECSREECLARRDEYQERVKARAQKILQELKGAGTSTPTATQALGKTRSVHQDFANKSNEKVIRGFVQAFSGPMDVRNLRQMTKSLGAVRESLVDFFQSGKKFDTVLPARTENMVEKLLELGVEGAKAWQQQQRELAVERDSGVGVSRPQSAHVPPDVELDDLSRDDPEL